MSFIIGMFFDLFEDKIIEWFTDALEQLFTLATSLINDFWTHELISPVLTFIQVVANVVLVCSFVFMIFDIIEENAGLKSISWPMVIGNFLKAVIFANYFVWFGKTITTLVSEITAMIPLGGYVTDGISYSSVLNLIGPAGFVMKLLLVLFIIVAYAIFIFMSVLRFSNMLIHIIGGLYYIPDVARGDTSAIGSWLRQAIVIACTYAIQYLLFTMGFTLIFGAELFTTDMILGVGLIIGMFAVPKILQKYGMSTGVSGVVSAAGNLASKAGSLIPA